MVVQEYDTSSIVLITSLEQSNASLSHDFKTALGLSYFYTAHCLYS